MDPIPYSDFDLQTVWQQLRQTWFPEFPLLDAFEILWSRRAQKRVLASCSLLHSRVRVARELNCTKCFAWTEPLLYHELCHAFLGVYRAEVCDYRRHGPLFKVLEARHPQMKSFNRWVREGGWVSAVRRDRAVRVWHLRKKISEFA